MADSNPAREEFLGLVSEWSSYGKQSGSRVGNAYPIYNFTRSCVVEKPTDEFPNPGAVFLLNRNAETWDFVLLQPQENVRYKDASERDCFYICSQTIPLEENSSIKYDVAVVLDVPTFKPEDSSYIIKNPTQNTTNLFFVRNILRRIYGPLRRTRVNRTAMDALDNLHWEPWNEDSQIYEFTEENLLKKGVKLATYRHPTPEMNEILQLPIHLLIGPVTAVQSEQVYDRLPDAQLAEWYVRWRQIPDISPEFLKSFRDAETFAKTHSELIKSRCRRLGKAFRSLDLLQGERANLAQQFLQTEEGRKSLEQELAIEIERRSVNLGEEVKKRQSDLANEEQRLGKEMEHMRDEHGRQVEILVEEKRVLDNQKTRLRDDIRNLEEHLQADADKLAAQFQANVPLFAALTGGLRSAPGHEPRAIERATREESRVRWGEARPLPPTKELETPKEESQVVDMMVVDLAAERLFFARDFLANLYVTLKSSPLNLIIGPPGHGKSTVVSALARALGHGNALLEVAVRRSWSDDRYLMGFYDTFHGRYDPGPTGLATRLHQAQRDWETERKGIYFVLLDEFNLAAPEYYFSQLLQIVTRSQGARVVPLFDPNVLPVRDDESVHQITIHPNVIFWGTINYDETTERLSPRVLDRTGMIFLSARDVVPSSSGGSRLLSSRGLSAATLCQQFAKTPDECPEEHWELLQPLFQLLRQQSEDWGPGVDLSPRVINAIKRYLANSVKVLPAVRAVDFVFEQRVLPVLSGRESRFVSRIRALQEKLTLGGLERSARHVHRALESVEQNFGDIDFLAYH